MAFDHWNKKRTWVTRIQLLYVAWTKFSLKEIDFLEFKDRVKAIEGAKDWVSRYEVPEKALGRFREFGVLDPERNTAFFRMYKDGKFANIHKYGIKDFELKAKQEETNASTETSK